jgi:hypothetical protein
LQFGQGSAFAGAVFRVEVLFAPAVAFGAG